MNEFELIALLTRQLPANEIVVAGAGDDCAVLDFGNPERLFLFKTDATVEGTHFTQKTPPEKTGRKAMARCLSDVAAMAGWPSAAVATVGLPQGFDPAMIARIYNGMAAVAREFGVAIVGGETTTNPGGIFISIALLGTVARGRQVLRSGAKVGDAIFVTGELGGSLAGKHLDFEPRLAQARWLAEHFQIHAMMDLSDGLAGDLPHILKASGVGAELLKSAIPISQAAKSAAKKSIEGKQALLAALTDGEDFELLFTVAARDAVKLADAWKGRFPALRLSCIGRIVAGKKIFIRDKGGTRALNLSGYSHFNDKCFS